MFVYLWIYASECLTTYNFYINEELEQFSSHFSYLFADVNTNKKINLIQKPKS